MIPPDIETTEQFSAVYTSLLGEEVRRVENEGRSRWLAAHYDDGRVEKRTITVGEWVDADAVEEVDEE